MAKPPPPVNVPGSFSSAEKPVRRRPAIPNETSAPVLVKYVAIGLKKFSSREFWERELKALEVQADFLQFVSKLDQLTRNLEHRQETQRVLADKILDRLIAGRAIGRGAKRTGPGQLQRELTHSALGVELYSESLLEIARLNALAITLQHSGDDNRSVLKDLRKQLAIELETHEEALDLVLSNFEEFVSNGTASAVRDNVEAALIKFWQGLRAQSY